MRINLAQGRIVRTKKSCKLDEILEAHIRQKTPTNMKSKKTRLALALCCIGSLAATNVARAVLAQIKVVANPGVSGLTSTANNSISGQGGGGSTTWAGNWTAKITSADGPLPGGSPAINAEWQSFCMDIDNAMSSGGTYGYTPDVFSNGNPPANNPPDPMWVAGGGAKAGYLYAEHLLDMTGASGDAKLVYRSALCIAIWEVLYESGGTYSVSTFDATKGFKAVSSGGTSTGLGNGTLANQAIYFANTWLTDAMADGFDNAPTSTWWREASGSDPQSLMGAPTAVPEPGTYVAGVLLLLPFAASMIRRKTKVG